MYEISYNLHGNDPNFQLDCAGHNKEHTDGSEEGDSTFGHVEIFTASQRLSHENVHNKSG